MKVLSAVEVGDEIEIESYGVFTCRVTGFDSSGRPTVEIIGSYPIDCDLENDEWDFDWRP